MMIGIMAMRVTLSKSDKLPTCVLDCLVDDCGVATDGDT